MTGVLTGRTAAILSVVAVATRAGAAGTAGLRIFGLDGTPDSP